MEKIRPLILVVAVLLTFQYLQYIYPTQEIIPTSEEAISKQQPTNLSAAPATAPVSTTTVAPAPTIEIKEDILLSNEKAHIILSNNGAVVTSVELQTFFSDVDDTIPLILLSDLYGKASFGTRLVKGADLQVWEITTQNTNTVTFTRPDATGLILTKTFVLSDNGELAVTTTITNPTVNTIAVAPHLDGPAGIEIEPGALLGHSSMPFVFGLREDGSIELKDADLDDIKEEGYSSVVSNRLLWFSLRSKYFVAASKVANPALYDQIIGSYFSTGAENEDLFNESLATTLIAQTKNLGSKESISYSFTTYLGPISREAFAEDANLELEPLADLGRLAPICSILIGILNFFNAIVSNYGVAILLLTFSVKVMLHPLTAKGMRSMYAMQKLGPKLKELKAKYGKDRQKFGAKQMELFKEEGVNPVMGCLPMLLQMPVYIALYTTLTRVIEVRHASFLWIDDLSSADALFSFGTTIPFLGDTFNLLPLMWMISMFFQQKMTPKSPDPNMAQQQKMMQFIPFVFGFMMYDMPAGLMIYWVAQNIFSIIEQAKIRAKYMPKTDVVAAK